MADNKLPSPTAVIYTNVIIRIPVVCLSIQGVFIPTNPSQNVQISSDTRILIQIILNI